MRRAIEEERFVLVDSLSREVRADAKRADDDFRESVRAGLTATPKSLSCRHFYDAEGSALFEQICALPEYYPTRTEAAILRACASDVVECVGAAPQLVELGSGSAEKTRILIRAFLERHGELGFVPIDISPDALVQSSYALLNDFPALDVHAIAAQYVDGIAGLPVVEGSSRLVLWLGSSIGNADRAEAAAFLTQLHRSLGEQGAMLVGIDLRKDASVLERAYDDAAGVTARFNKNLLARINRELGGAFDLDRFEHRATYDAELGRVEMHLVARDEMTVPIRALELDVAFRAGESIHTENSYKYSTDEIQELADASGFRLEAQWFDESKLFSVNLLRP